MAKDIRYTWTVSIIAMVDPEEEKNGEIIVDAYNELEDSIRSVRNPNKDIKFVIYKYDVSTSTAEIRKSKAGLSGYKLKIIDRKKIGDFYAEGHTHLVEFFQEHVAKTKIKDNEIHRHLFIIWGHAAGLGFLAQRIKENLYEAFNSSDKGKVSFDENIVKVTNKILLYNYLRSNLSLTINEPPFKELLNDLLLNEIGTESLKVTENQKKLIGDILKIITAKDLSEILKKGLKDDVSSTTKKNDIMLCLSCYTNMIETGYQLMDQVNYYIAPQTMISFYGYNYRELFRLLTMEPKSSEKKIVDNITHYYLSKYIEPPIADKVKDDFEIYGLDYKRRVSFSGIMLEEYKEAVKVLVNFKDKVKMLIDENVYVTECVSPKTPIIEILIRARGKCLPVTYGGAVQNGIIDFNNFVNEFFQYFEDPKSHNPDDYIFEKHVIANYYPGELAQSRYYINDERYMSQSPGGFSIFFPNSSPSEMEKILIKIYYSSSGPARFLKDSNWDEFLKLLYP